MCGFCNVWVCVFVGFVMCGRAYVWVCVCVGVCIFGLRNVWACVCADFVKCGCVCGCFDNICTCIYLSFCIVSFMYIYFYLLLV